MRQRATMWIPYAASDGQPRNATKETNPSSSYNACSASFQTQHPRNRLSLISPTRIAARIKSLDSNNTQVLRNRRPADLPPPPRQTLSGHRNSPAHPVPAHSTSAGPAPGHSRRRAVHNPLAAGRSSLAAVADRDLVVVVGKVRGFGEAERRCSGVGRGRRRSGLAVVLVGRREVGLLEDPIRL